MADEENVEKQLTSLREVTRTGFQAVENIISTREREMNISLDAIRSKVYSLEMSMQRVLNIFDNPAKGGVETRLYALEKDLTRLQEEGQERQVALEGMKNKLIAALVSSLIALLSFFGQFAWKQITTGHQ